MGKVERERLEALFEGVDLSECGYGSTFNYDGSPNCPLAKASECKGGPRRGLCSLDANVSDWMLRVGFHRDVFATFAEAYDEARGSGLTIAEGLKAGLAAVEAEEFK